MCGWFAPSAPKKKEKKEKKSKNRWLIQIDGVERGGEGGGCFRPLPRGTHQKKKKVGRKRDDFFFESFEWLEVTPLLSQNTALTTESTVAWFFKKN